MGRTVLVADDSPSIQNKAKGILTGEGLEVVTVSNGVAAIKKLQTIRAALILADVSMPGRDGYAVLTAMDGVSALEVARVALQPCHLPLYLPAPVHLLRQRQHDKQHHDCSHPDNNI